MTFRTRDIHQVCGYYFGIRSALTVVGLNLSQLCQYRGLERGEGGKQPDCNPWQALGGTTHLSGSAVSRTSLTNHCKYLAGCHFIAPRTPFGYGQRPPTLNQETAALRSSYYRSTT